MRTVFVDGQGSVRSGWKMLGAVVLTALGAAGLIFVRRLLPADVRHFLPEQYLAFLGALFASWVCLRLERRPFASLGLTPDGRFARELGVGLVGGTALLGLVALIVWLTGGYHLARVPEAGVALLLEGAWTMLGVALFEEVLFRGYLLQRAMHGLGRRGGQVLLAVLFCLAHTYPPELGAAGLVLAMLNTFLAGLLLGLCAVRMQRLALAVGVHLGWNWAQQSLGFGVSGHAPAGLWTPVFHGQPQWLTGGQYGLEASAVAAVVLALAVVALARRARGSQPSTAPAVAA
ncbi:CPBP family intramembrane metalloprotease [Aggregicoccus sp. 17bor-14]|uniref:CPBP family intramembrane glutamic endopeptidase n=1 Tax=Myxococcaceae TaxID=31 RepID=UPI00129CBD47|nr:MULTISPECIES: type II CAAX endopeptidase family protein [Myxococcaceae]MBF5041613.1 CPBP family intramembrane metalloprotease [Simulacricoccus sp. 17bor-14]MRI87398.1 CPBP family intramembrane metalloprotease [Aggregicoccus sp. 17bor-14]